MKLQRSYTVLSIKCVNTFKIKLTYSYPDYKRSREFQILLKSKIGFFQLKTDFCLD